MSYLFGAETSIHVGDPYKDHKEKREPEKKAKKKPFKGSRQFLTNPSKKGRVGGGVLFGNFEYKAEKYVQKRIISKPKVAIVKPFRFTSPPSKPSGRGSYFGTIGGKFEHMQEHDVVKKGEVRKKVVKEYKRNIITNPPKQGTYGFVGTTLQKDLFRHGDDPKVKKKPTPVKKKKKKISVPFRTTSNTKPFFDSHDNVPASKVYTVPEKIMKKMREDAKKLKEGVREKVKKVSVKPWRPGKENKGAINKHPEHVVDPYEKKVKRDPKNVKPSLVFKPCNVAKSGPTRSIVFSKFK